MVSRRRGKSHRHWAEALFGWEDGTQCSFFLFPSLLHSSSRISNLIRNAEASPRKLTVLPSIFVSCYSLKGILERSRGICLPHSWWNPPIPNKRLLNRYLCCHGQVLTEAHCLSTSQCSFCCRSTCWPVQSAKPGKSSAFFIQGVSKLFSIFFTKGHMR